MPSPDRLDLWPLRGTWVVLAVLASTAATGALDGRSAAVSVTASAIGWAAWGAGLVALLVPRSAGLTVVRIVGPAVAAEAAMAAVAGPGADLLGIATLVVALLTVILVLAPWTSDRFVDGSSYGPERRVPLRTPVAIAALAVGTWMAVVVGAVAGPLLLAAGRVPPGIAALVVGWPIAALGCRSIHQLSRRWVVLVPTGMVLHDPLTMPEPQLFLRQTMARLGPALVAAVPAREDGAPAPVVEDLTAGASGLVLELELDEPVELLVLEGRRGSTLRDVDAVRFTPSRPAALLEEARSRRLPVA